MASPGVSAVAACAAGRARRASRFAGRRCRLDSTTAAGLEVAVHKVLQQPGALCRWVCWYCRGRCCVGGHHAFSQDLTYMVSAFAANRMPSSWNTCLRRCLDGPRSSNIWGALSAIVLTSWVEYDLLGLSDNIQSSRSVLQVRAKMQGYMHGWKHCGKASCSLRLVSKQGHPLDGLGMAHMHCPAREIVFDAAGYCGNTELCSV